MYFTIRSQHAIVKTTRGTEIFQQESGFKRNRISQKSPSSPTKRFLQKFYSNLETEQQKLLQNEKEEVTMKKAFEKVEAFLERYYKGIAPAYKM